MAASAFSSCTVAASAIILLSQSFWIVAASTEVAASANSPYP